MSDPDALPEPDRVEGAPHPRETAQLFGQTQAETEFLDAFTSGRMHSGWMITGPRGIGKATLAWKIATFLLAQAPDDGLFGDPLPPTSLYIADDHPDAKLVMAGAHPRLHVIRRPYNFDTKKLRAEITVDAVRGLKEFFHMSAADGGRRVVIVDAADEMNRNAANAILKELEEPPANTTIMLVAHQPSGLLPTIRSRCRTLRCTPLDTPDLDAALAQAGFDATNAEALAALAEGSAGDAIRILQHDGLTLYGELIKLFSTLPRMDRPAAIKLAATCAGRGAEARYAMTLDLTQHFLARTARTGITGAPQSQGAAQEALLLQKLSPDANAARSWANLQQDLSARTTHGRAVNLDPASLVLDMLFKIEDTAARLAHR